MSIFKDLKHYKDIFWLIYKYGQFDLLQFNTDIDLPQILKERGEEKGKAEDLVKDLEALGPFYIKLGQILSAEADFLPPDYSEALKKLLDKADPMPYEDIESIIVQELGDKPQNIFRNFQKDSISAASLGQVHYAETLQGKKVAVKIQRKNIQEDILTQLEAIEKISRYLEEKTEWGKKYQIIEKFQNLKIILLSELDYIKEANNLKILHHNLKNFEQIIIPLPLDAYTTSHVLTMDYIKAEKITDLSREEKANLHFPELAEELFKAFLKQILVDGFFQMDPHPGNVAITRENGATYLAFFDLGMVGHIPFQMQGEIIRCLFSMNEGHELAVTKILINLGKRRENFDEYFLRSKIAAIMASYRGLTLSQMSLGTIVLKLAHTAAEAGLLLPIQFSTIGKTFISLDPVLKGLDPDFEPQIILQQEASGIFKNRLSKNFSTQSFYGALLEGSEFFQQLPGKINGLFDLFSQGDYKLKLHLLESESITRNFEKIANRITMGLILAALVIAASLLMRIDTPFRLFGYPGFAMVMFLLAAGGAFWLILSILWVSKKDTAG